MFPEEQAVLITQLSRGLRQEADDSTSYSWSAHGVEYVQEGSCTQATKVDACLEWLGWVQTTYGPFTDDFLSESQTLVHLLWIFNNLPSDLLRLCVPTAGWEGDVLFQDTCLTLHKTAGVSL